MLEGDCQVHGGIQRGRFKHLDLRLHGLAQVICEDIPFLGVSNWMHPREILEKALGVLRHRARATCRDQLAKGVGACRRPEVIGDESLELSPGRPLAQLRLEVAVPQGCDVGEMVRGQPRLVGVLRSLTEEKEVAACQPWPRIARPIEERKIDLVEPWRTISRI